MTERFRLSSVGHNRRHAALATLCVFAVLLAASLFPASGFGAYPAGVWSDSGTGAPGTTAAGPSTTVEFSTTTESTTATATTQRTTDGSTTTTATTTEQTTTERAAADPGDGGFDGGDLSGLYLGVGALLAGLVGFGFVRGALSATSAAEAIPFTITVRGVPIGDLIGGLPERTMTLVVGFSSSVPQLLDDTASLTSEVTSGLAMVLSGTGSALGRIASAGAGGLFAAFTAVPRALSGFSGVSGLFSDVSVPSLGRDSSGRDRSRPSSTTADESEPSEPRPPTVEEAWETMADRVFVRNRRARTPEEFARAALERGYPDDAVRKLTRTFQEVRYGRRSRTDRTPTARSALDRIQRYWDGDDE